MLNRKIISIKIPKEGFLENNELDSKEHLTLATAILMVEEERIIFKNVARADFPID